PGYHEAVGWPGHGAIERAVRELSSRAIEARGVRARSVARRLHDLSRAARFDQSQTARAGRCESLPALSRAAACAGPQRTNHHWEERSHAISEPRHLLDFD